MSEGAAFICFNNNTQTPGECPGITVEGKPFRNEANYVFLKLACFVFKCVLAPIEKQNTLWRCISRSENFIVNSETSPWSAWVESFSARKIPFIWKQHKQPDYSLQICTEIKILIPEDMASGLMKLKLNCWPKWPSLHLDGKEGHFQAWKQNPKCDVRSGSITLWAVLLQEEFAYSTKLMAL